MLLVLERLATAGLQQEGQSNMTRSRITPDRQQSSTPSQVTTDPDHCRTNGQPAPGPGVQRVLGNQAVQRLEAGKDTPEGYPRRFHGDPTRLLDTQLEAEASNHLDSSRAVQAQPPLGTKVTSRQESISVTNDLPPVARESPDTTGRPIATPDREFMEARFGLDFSHVRIHDGVAAAASADALGANAYTVGSHIVFNSGQYTPGSESSRRLLAHELTHVVQQASGRGRRYVTEPGDAWEREADRVAQEVTRAPNRQQWDSGPPNDGGVNLTAPRGQRPIIARDSDGEGGDVRFFMAPTIVWSGAGSCPSSPSVLRSVMDQVRQHTQENLEPALESLRRVAGQSGLASQGAGLVDKFLSVAGQASLWIIDAVMSIGGSAASDVANALSSDIQRINDLLVNAEAHAISGAPQSARLLIDEAFGLLARNMYWLRFRDRRPPASEFNIFGDCSSEED